MAGIHRENQGIGKLMLEVVLVSDAYKSVYILKTGSAPLEIERGGEKQLFELGF